ncbi:HRF1 protein [Citrus sinensis]|uniref:HRF1 protein n=1 Tax=Citrus sinensis TaxID=2711 RepID=A0ACB8MD11_CITSI|nr:HRF1 protein [Citrus sinensis]
MCGCTRDARDTHSSLFNFLILYFFFSVLSLYRRYISFQFSEFTHPSGRAPIKRRRKTHQSPIFCGQTIRSCSDESSIEESEMYSNMGTQPGPGMPRPAADAQPNPFGNAFYGAGSGLIRGGLGAYGEKILGSSSEYVQSNISRYFSDPQYYFQVNDQYVRNKLKGHWTRITEPVGGRLSYKPPIYDINAPDLYIPFMAFGTYVVLAGFTLGLQGK